MTARPIPCPGLVLALALALHPLAAQDSLPPPRTPPAISVFLDCNTFFCDFDHFRRAVPYVNWVRNREDADVHLLITSQQTGGGGWELTLAFLGRRELAGRSNTLRYVSDRTDTEDEVRAGLTRLIEMGLVGYVADRAEGRRLTLSYDSAAAAPAAATAEDDPWNFWTFAVRIRGSADGESQFRSFFGGGSVSANRITEALKLTFTLSGDHNRQEFDVLDSAAGIDTTFVSTRTSYGVRQLAVWSLGPHWSAGFRSSAQASTFLNQDLAIRAGPAVEFDVFPYGESTRRLLTVSYAAGLALFDYERLTIFDRTRETHPLHELEVGLQVQQPWGSVFTSATATQFLHDLARHRLDLFGSLNIRLVRGLDFNVFGSVARIKDQLYLAQEGLTPEEILLRQRQLGTDFRYFVSLGLTYRFGSKFSNVVNPRFGGGGGPVFFF